MIRKARPDYLVALYPPFTIDWQGEEPDGSKPWYTMPMFSVQDDKLTWPSASRRHFAG